MGFSRLTVLKYWCWIVCVALILIGAIGVFSNEIGPLPTNRVHALALNLGLGFVGFGFVRFGAERAFVLYSGIAMAALGIMGFIPSVRPWLYETFNLETASSYIELSAGVISLVVWAAARSEDDPGA